MSLLDNHLEQIMLSSNAIAELPFPPPRIFTNALLGPHDITALIRDTETHERALFQTDPSVKSIHPSQRRSTRRGTVFPSETEGESMASRIYAARNHRNQSAVARVLGSDMMEEIKRSAGTSAKGRGEVNVEVLFKGAEILCNVYPVAGAQEKIASLRYRHQLMAESILKLEGRVARNTAELEKMSHSYGDGYDDYETTGTLQPDAADITEADIEREMEEIRELERKKRTLEAHVSGMERDLGGLMG
ncbi:DASH complex subunit Spc34 [Aspergillus coremiiformis]|uniref:DASH complex subunit SPC34 n=1 Tax=Aspergillus coremiiformis TaxID=138285 RepID=A0A5N6Z630_9EURO|nr:DASH complex subunit Spc34 [Aspergillus coremiiformis]